MMRGRVLLIAGPLLAAAAPLPAQGSGPGDLRVTIYNQDLALVQDTRTLAIPVGRSRQDFPGVSAQIRPETVSFSADGTGIVEQNFDFDLLSPGKLIEKAVGQLVTIVRVNPATGAETREQARVLSTNGGVVLQIGERIEVLRDDGLPVRVIFDRVPENLRARPTLSVTVDSRRGGTRPATLSYLTPGLRWKADYVAAFDEAAGAIDVQGWITLTNNTGAAYPDADVMMVAGTPRQVNPRRRYYGGDGEDGETQDTIRQAGTEAGTRGRLGDYYLYPLGARTTIANAQTKQVSFLDVQGARAARAYEFRVGNLDGTGEARSAATVLKFSNSAKGGLGDQLPAGVVRVYIKDARGAPQFIGESGIGHTPAGSELALRTGEAFDVRVKAAVEKRARIRSDDWEVSGRYRITDSRTGVRTRTIETNPVYYRTTMAYTLSNARPTPVTVDLLQAGLDLSGTFDTRAFDETVPGRQRSLDERVYAVTVPANGEVVLRATFDTRY